MSTVAVTRRLPGAALTRLAAEHEVVVWPGDLPPAPMELWALTAGADALLCLLTDRIDADLLAAAPHLRAVANYAVGFDNIDVDAVRARGIAVGVTPDVLTDATADLTLALLLSAARGLPQAAAAVRTGAWRTWEPRRWLGLELRGATLALVGGRGRIGRAVAERAAAFGMNVECIGRDDDLRAALARADVVSLHCPLTAETARIIDADALATMRPGSVLVNTARGGLVDQVALRAALERGHLAAAALDVTDPEPLPPDDPLLSAPNLLVLPHIGSATHRARERMADIAVDNLLAALRGAPMPHPAPGL
ncbi:NAD(P)-dependent oxidoreductase [Paraconexibacter sp.]|uniref:NAD(P)-dependent oxidoreductase n=1 Tax=Paraconexibacter sp. TaxID=2949640 RepID=UPI003567B86F